MRYMFNSRKEKLYSNCKAIRIQLNIGCMPIVQQNVDS